MTAVSRWSARPSDAGFVPSDGQAAEVAVSSVVAHEASVRPLAIRPAPRRATRVDTGTRAVMVRMLKHLRGGRLTVIEADGTVLRFGEPTDLDVTVRLRTPAVWREVTTRASIGLGESFIDGWWDTDDLTGFVRLAIRNLEALDGVRNRWDSVSGPVSDPIRRLRKPDKDRDRREIRAHYDLGNDFFSLFLDPETMAYSCGLFDSPLTALADAQREKFDRLCRSLELSADDHLVEIGTGWGGMAVHAARTYGATVTTCTISDEQYRYARDLVEREGLTDRVTVLKKDYRDLTGAYDKLVSVEMIEAVDWRDHTAYFATCCKLLKPGGRMALQAITVPDSRFERAKTSSDFVSRFVFPGSCLPSLDAITSTTRRTGDLRLVQLDEFPQHYAETLHRWWQNLDGRADEARALGYDDALLRLWEFYLCYCEGAFAERYVSVVQAVFARPGWKPDTLGVRP